jgi:hypothetical protein
MLRCAIPIFLAVLLFSPPAHANAMIPIIVAGWFGMFLALVPIILIESVVLTRVGAHIWESLLAMSAANLGSTLVGIPLAIVLEFVVATNTPLYDESGDPKDTWYREWMLPVGGVLLLIPFFLMSWWIEAPIAAWILDDLPTRFVDVAVRDANLLTYGLLAGLLGLLLALALRDTDASVYRNRDREAEYVRSYATRQRDINLRHQPRPMHSIGLHESWRLANEQARRGIASLGAAETRIDRKRLIHAVADVREFYDASDEKAA